MENQNKVDLHLHTLFSDGTDSFEELFLKLRKEGINICSVTDHDTIDFYLNTNTDNYENIKFITGVEFSCISKSGKSHILGYDFSINSPSVKKIIDKGQEMRRRKLRERLEYLENVIGLKLLPKDKDYLYSLKSAGKPHIAKILIDMGLADTITDGINKYLKNIPGGDNRPQASFVIEAIESAGGVAVWAHPLGGEGERLLEKDEFSEKLDDLMSCGIRGIECYYSRYNKEQSVFLSQEADRYKLLKSGGSDYHGNVKNIRLGQLSSDNSRNDFEKLSVLNIFKR